MIFRRLSVADAAACGRCQLAVRYHTLQDSLWQLQHALVLALSSKKPNIWLGRLFLFQIKMAVYFVSEYLFYFTAHFLYYI